MAALFQINDSTRPTSRRRSKPGKKTRTTMPVESVAVFRASGILKLSVAVKNNVKNHHI